MADVKVTTLGKQAKTALPEEAFGADFHETAVFETARADLAARRGGNASTLTRGEVAMTGAKAWRQKGTGRARIGAHSVPHRRGGGVAFGPKPRRYTVKVNRKLQRRALASALSVHAARDSIAVFDAGSFSEPKTSQAAGMLAKWGAKQPVLVALGDDELAAAKSFRNLPGARVIPARAVGVADIVGNASLLASEAAVEVFTARVTGAGAAASNGEDG